MYKVITYGFNTKASITTSSIGDTVYRTDSSVVSRGLFPPGAERSSKPQEYKLRFDAGGLDSHNLLAAASFAIVNGIDLNSFSGKPSDVSR
jgi:hypothetical protein